MGEGCAKLLWRAKGVTQEVNQPGGRGRRPPRVTPRYIPYRYLSVSQALPCPPEDNRSPESGYSMSEDSRRHVGVNKVASQEPLETWRS